MLSLTPSIIAQNEDKGRIFKADAIVSSGQKSHILEKMVHVMYVLVITFSPVFYARSGIYYTSICIIFKLLWYL